MATIKLKRGQESKVPSLPKEDGSLIFGYNTASTPATIQLDQNISGTVQRLDLSVANSSTSNYSKNSAALGGSSLSQILAQGGNGNSFTGLDTTTNNIVKLTRANGGTVQKTIDNVSHATSATIATSAVSLQTFPSTLTLGSGGPAIIDQDSATYRQRIRIEDNSTSGDNVFVFQQSSDAGVNYKDLFRILDNGSVIASTFTGYLNGNAKNSNALGGSSLSQILAQSGSGNAFTGLDTTTNNVIKLTRANGGTVQKTINNVANATSASMSTSSNKLISRGNITAIGSTQTLDWSGLWMSNVYNNGYPISYGNLINLHGGGYGQILIGWNGTNPGNFIRAKRDITSEPWTPWARIATSLDALNSSSSAISSTNNYFTAGATTAYIASKVSSLADKTAFTGLDTATNNVVKLTRANGGTVQKTINNVANATSATISSTSNISKNSNALGGSSLSQILSSAGSGKYLPLAGGTLTGTISGPAANFNTLSATTIKGPGEIDYKTNSPNLYKLIDLSSTVYDQNKWYPVVGNGLNSYGFTHISCNVQLNSGTKPSWSTHNSGFTCNLDILAKAGGWGTTGAESIIRDYSYKYANQNPLSYFQLTNSSKPCIYMRGGGKYRIYTSNPQYWAIITSPTTYNSQVVQPQDSCPAISVSRSTAYVNIDGVTTTANLAKNSNALGGSSLQQILDSFNSGNIAADSATRIVSSSKSIANNFTIRTGVPTSSWTQYPIFPIYNTTDADLTAYKGKSLSILHMDGGAQRHDIVALNGANDGLVYATATSAGTTSSRIERILDGGNYGSLITNLSKQVTFANGLKVQKNVQMDGGNFSTGSTVTTGNGETSISNVKISVSGNTLVITTK